MNKEEKLKNQRRQERRGQKARERKKKVLHSKHIQSRKKPVIQKTNINNMSLKVKIRFFIQGIILTLKRLGCVIGIHDWKLCSGRIGDPMYTCIRCWAKSKKKWENRGSREYYEEKHKDKLGITDPKNWEKKEGDYYFKGEYVKLTEEEVRRLEVVLKSKK